MAPFFSIIIPLYNRKGRIDRAVQSVLNQTFLDWELIIVDDASTDGSWEYIQKYSDSRIKVSRNQHNSERCLTRNNGISLAKGQYICFLDSDDYHLPQHLNALHELISSKNYPKAFFFTNAWDENEEGVRSERNCPEFQITDPCTYFLRYTVNPQRWAVHKSVMLLHQFDPLINICEDMDTSLRIVSEGIPVFQLMERTTCYVSASDSFTHGSTDKWERELSNLKRIFVRPNLKHILPRRETNRLISMCHYHLSFKNFNSTNRLAFYRHALISFILCPSGYNGKTNLSLVVMALYSIPLIGPSVRYLMLLKHRIVNY